MLLKRCFSKHALLKYKQKQFMSNNEKQLLGWICCNCNASDESFPTQSNLANSFKKQNNRFRMTEVSGNARPKIGDSIVDVIGNTPCVRLGRLARENGVVANIVLKLESMEPCSSVKDRIAKSMIMEAEQRGDIIPGVTTLVEPTSGNTGIGLAMVAAARGYALTVVMPSTLSLERRVMLKALGATLVLTPGEKGMSCSIKKAQEIVDELGPGKAYMLNQFSNTDNPKVHR
jgi:threonine dehydratase